MTDYLELPKRVAELERQVEELKERLYLLSARMPPPGGGAYVVSDEEILEDYRRKKAHQEQPK